jgi:hypothetical protein
VRPALELQLTDRLSVEGEPVLSLDLRNVTDTSLLVISAGLHLGWLIDLHDHGRVSAGSILIVDPTRSESYAIAPGELLSLRYSFADRVPPCPIDCSISGWAQSRPAGHESPWPDADVVRHKSFVRGRPVFADWTAAGWRFPIGPLEWPPLPERRGPVVASRSTSPADVLV